MYSKKNFYKILKYKIIRIKVVLIKFYKKFLNVKKSKKLWLKNVMQTKINRKTKVKNFRIRYAKNV